MKKVLLIAAVLALATTAFAKTIKVGIINNDPNDLAIARQTTAI